MLLICNFVGELSLLARLLWITMQSLQARLNFLNAIQSGQDLEFYLTSQLNINPEVIKKIEEDLSKLSEQQVHCVSYFHSEYPERLRQIIDPPLILFYLGELIVSPINKLRKKYDFLYL